MEDSLTKHNRSGKAELAQKETTEWNSITDEKWQLNVENKHVVKEYSNLLYYSVTLCWLVFSKGKGPTVPTRK